MQPSLVLCDDIERWDGGREGGSEGGDVCIIMADSSCVWQRPT